MKILRKGIVRVILIPILGSQIRFAYKTIQQVIHAVFNTENQKEWKSEECKNEHKEQK